MVTEGKISIAIIPARPLCRNLLEAIPFALVSWSYIYIRLKSIVVAAYSIVAQRFSVAIHSGSKERAKCYKGLLQNNVNI